MTHTHRNLPEETIVHKQSFLDSFDADTIVDWLSRNSKNIIYVFLSLIALFILVYRLSSSHTVKSEKDYFQAASDFSAFMRDNSDGEAVTQEAFGRLTTLINSHPELHSAYDGAIAQTLLNRGQTAEAKPFIVNTLNRIQDEGLKLYNSFASTTLLISESQYEEALKASQTLHQTMLEELNKGIGEDRSFSEVLFAFNLLRIAMLHQQLKNNNEELLAWQQWKSYSGLDRASKKPTIINPMAFRVIIQQLATGNIALPDYIAYREKALK
jgi:predicted negative regulator of RcsB-dependent stress response